MNGYNSEESGGRGGRGSLTPKRPMFVYDCISFFLFVLEIHVDPCTWFAVCMFTISNMTLREEALRILVITCTDASP